VPPPPELSVRTRKELGGVKKPAAKKSTTIAPTTTQQPSDKGKPAKKQIPDNCGGKLFPHLAKYCANESVTDPKCNCVPGSPANIRAMVEETEKTPTSAVKDLWLLFMGHGVTPYNPELLVK
jgi:hypothetical protein